LIQQARKFSHLIRHFFVPAEIQKSNPSAMVRTKAKVRQDGLKNEKTLKPPEFFCITKNLESALCVILFLFFFLKY
jgi:hypothetical protein